MTEALQLSDSYFVSLKADQLRRSAKLRRLNPDASPYINLMAPWLDYEDGDPERIEDFVEDARHLAIQPRSPSGFLGLGNAALNWLAL